MILSDFYKVLPKSMDWSDFWSLTLIEYMAIIDKSTPAAPLDRQALNDLIAHLK
jgi:hypothetical protein